MKIIQCHVFEEILTVKTRSGKVLADCRSLEMCCRVFRLNSKFAHE